MRGNSIDGTQAEYVRIPYADTGLYLLPPGADEEAMAMLSCTLPTGLECGVLSGQVKPGDSVAIVGALSGSSTCGLSQPKRPTTADPAALAPIGTSAP